MTANQTKSYIYIGYYYDNIQTVYAIGRKNVSLLRKKYNNIFARKVQKKKSVRHFLSVCHYVPEKHIHYSPGIYRFTNDKKEVKNLISYKPSIEPTNISLLIPSPKLVNVYYANNGSIIAITHNYKVSFSNFYTKKELPISDSLLKSIKYFVKIDSTKERPKENVVSKIRANSCFGDSYIMFNDYYFATAFVASFHSNNVFLIRNIISNTITQMSNEKTRLLLLQNPEHEYLSISWYNTKEKLNEALAKFKNEEEYSRQNQCATYNIYVDGSCVLEKNTYSWAFVVYENGKEIYFDKGYETQEKYMKHGTQVGEFLAMCRAMKFVVDQKLTDVIIWYDNVQNFNCLEHVKTKSDTFDIYKKYFEYTSKMRQSMLSNNLTVDYKHVKAHTGIAGNERADRLAKQAIYEINSIF